MPLSHFITGLDSTEPSHSIVQHVHVEDRGRVGNRHGRVFMQPLFRINEVIHIYIKTKKMNKRVFQLFLKLLMSQPI